MTMSLIFNVGINCQTSMGSKARVNICWLGAEVHEPNEVAALSDSGHSGS